MLPPSSPDPAPFGNPLQELHNCEAIDLPEPVLRSAAVDPLGDEIYFRAHRKFERQEKQLRNIERDRAQHEKQTVDRLLEELRSELSDPILASGGIELDAICFSCGSKVGFV